MPPYSPDLNPIEEMFSKVKACLREDVAIQKVDERGVTYFVEAAFQLLVKKTYLDGMIILDTLRTKVHLNHYN